MIDVQEMFLWVNFVANKLQSGAISPDEYNQSLASANKDLLKLKIGLPEEYQVGNPQPRQAYQITQKLTEDIAPFIKKVNIGKSANGYFALPTDYAYFSSLRYNRIQSIKNGCKMPTLNTQETVSFEVVTDAELSIRLNNSVLKPTSHYPILAESALGLKPYPDNINTAELTYIRYPVTPLRAYTVVNDDSIYNPAGSVQIEYPAVLFNDFAALVLKYMAVNIRDNDLYAMNEQRKNQGI